MINIDYAVLLGDSYACKQADKSFFILQGASILWHFFAGKFVALTTRKASGAQFSPRSCEISSKNNRKDTFHKYKKKLGWVATLIPLASPSILEADATSCVKPSHVATLPD
jgi:hypothetical protein